MPAVGFCEVVGSGAVSIIMGPLYSSRSCCRGHLSVATIGVVSISEPSTGGVGANISSIGGGGLFLLEYHWALINLDQAGL